jgi:predicted AAA+ superfamily ATPase
MYLDKMFYFLLTQRIISFMLFLVILGTISTATTVLTKHVFITIKSHHTFNQTHKIYTQTTKKIFFFKLFFSNCNHNNYSKNKHSLSVNIIACQLYREQDSNGIHIKL